MAFPKRLLAEHERLVFDLKPHWVAVVPSVLWTLALAGLWYGGHRLAGSQLDDAGTVRLIVALVALGAWFAVALVPFLRWQFTHFVLTSDRLITRRGIVAKSSKEIPLERINDVSFNQTVIERMLGAGDLLLESAGERGQNVISNVRRPEEVQLMIYKEIESNSTRIVTGQHGNVAGDSIPEQIEQLARLRDQGALSDAEFESKKQELLRRL